MKVIFLDRDGVINENIDDGYVTGWDEFRFIPKSKAAIAALTDADWSVIVISNQAGIGKRVMSMQAVEEINARMVTEIERCGGKIEAVYYCPHRPDEDCECRKPKPGMLLKAACDFGVELPQSYLVGDKISDVQAGAEAGCKTVLVKTGWGQEHIRERDQWPVTPDHIVSDLSEAVELVLASERS